MMYVGFVISVAEAHRLFKLDASLAESFYDTKAVCKYLREKNSELCFRYIDKGACLFAIEVNITDEKTDFPYANIEDTFFQILMTKYAFVRELERLQIDTSIVHLTWIEEEEKAVEKPQPYVITL